MALMLAGGQLDEDKDASDEEPVKPKIVGRLLEDDPAEKAAAAARHAAAARAVVDEKARELPPLEFRQRHGHTKPHRDSKLHGKSKHEAGQNGSRHPTSADQAGADLDPVEDLISQIMEHEPSESPSEPKREAISPSVPLRELVLAWYESRGYRRSPASPAVWPIELVLRHREDAARAYAFVVQNDHVSVDRITALIEQAREIGMMRVAVIAEAGYERGAKEIAKRRHVRLIDRSSMEAELSELQLPTAAKIIAVARARSAAESSAA